MATCSGGNNPLSHLGKTLGGDRSLQRDEVRSRYMSREVRSAAPLPAENYHRSFDQLAVAPAPSRNEMEMQRAPMPMLAQSDWATEFSRLSLGQPQPLQQPIHTPNAIQRPLYTHHMQSGIAPSFMPSHSLTAASSLAQPARGPQFDPLAFDQAFALAEDKASKAETTEKTEEPDLSRVAQDVITSVSSSQTDNDTSSKLKQSTFINLMEKLSSREVTATEKNFVDSNGEIFNPSTVSNEPANMHYDQDISFTEANQQENVVNDERNPTLLEDPSDYMDRHQEKGLDTISSFEEANKLGPLAIPTSAWEENYDDNVWVPIEGR